MNFFMYYCTASEAVLAAHKADMLDCARIEGMGQAFADRFGAVAMFTRGFNPVFAGVTFTREKRARHPDLWTQKTDSRPMQHPKEQVKSPKLRESGLALRREWNDNFPKTAVVRWNSRLLKELGFETEGALFNQALSYMEHGGMAYIACTLPLGLEEITGSVYLAAVKAEEDVVKSRAQKPVQALGFSEVPPVILGAEA